MELPAGFERLEVGPATVVAKAELLSQLLALGVDDPLLLAVSAESSLQGRGALGCVDLGEHGRFVVRPLRRGGLLGRWRGQLSRDPDRSFSELRVSAGALARGAAVPEVVAAVSRAVRGGFQHGVVTRRVEGARDLLEILRSGSNADLRRRALRASGEAIHKLHQAGVEHVDLNLKNILLDAGGQALVIDLDRCRLHELLSQRLRERSLLRLYRSWCKLASAEPSSVWSRDPLYLVRAYAERGGAAQRRLLKIGRRARFPLHRLLWRLSPPRYG